MVFVWRRKQTHGGEHGILPSLGCKGDQRSSKVRDPTSLLGCEWIQSRGEEVIFQVCATISGGFQASSDPPTSVVFVEHPPLRGKPRLVLCLPPTHTHTHSPVHTTSGTHTCAGSRTPVSTSPGQSDQGWVLLSSPQTWSLVGRSKWKSIRRPHGGHAQPGTKSPGPGEAAFLCLPSLVSPATSPWPLPPEAAFLLCCHPSRWRRSCWQWPHRVQWKHPLFLEEGEERGFILIIDFLMYTVKLFSHWNSS